MPSRHNPQHKLDIPKTIAKRMKKDLERLADVMVDHDQTFAPEIIKVMVRWVMIHEAEDD